RRCGVTRRKLVSASRRKPTRGPRVLPRIPLRLAAASRLWTLQQNRLRDLCDRCSEKSNRPTESPSLAPGSKLVVFVFEQDVERRERSVTARDVLLQIELVRFAQFVARVHLLLENSQIIPDHDDLVEECLKRNIFRLKRTLRRLHDECPALPASRRPL